MSYTCLFYHIVFSTKERRPFLTDAILPRTREYIGGIIRSLEGQMLKANGSEDHLHVVTTCPATVTLASFIGKFKARSSGWIHETYPGEEGISWQEGYAAFSVSRSAVPRVLAYVEGQAEHHRRMTFQEELLALLEKHGIEGDRGLAPPAKSRRALSDPHAGAPERGTTYLQPRRGEGPGPCWTPPPYRQNDEMGMM